MLADLTEDPFVLLAFLLAECLAVPPKHVLRRPEAIDI